MESKEFKFLMYSTIIGNWDNALNIIDRLKKEVDSNQLPILTDIQKAIIARKNKDYETAKKLWKQIQIKGKNLNDTMADFAKVGYYNTIADSNKNLEKKYYLKIKKYCEKIGDSTLILIGESLISKKPEEKAILFKKVAEELSKAGDAEDAQSINGMHYALLAEASSQPEEKAKLYKQAAEELTKAGNTKQAHSANAWHYAFLAEATEKPEEKAELYKNAAGEHEKAGESNNSYEAKSLYYRWLAISSDKPEEKAELYKKAAEELRKAEDWKNFHNVNAWHYRYLAIVEEKPEEEAELHKKAAEELKKGGEVEGSHSETAMYYASLAEATEKHKEKAELYKKAVEESKKANEEKEAHDYTARYYVSLAFAEEKPEEKAKLIKKTAEELKEAGNSKYFHLFYGWYYRILASTKEKSEEKAELYKKAAEELLKGGDEDSAHRETSMYYESSAEATDKPDEKAELYKKAAEELKEAGDTENAHKLMANHYFFLSLSTENKAEFERYQLLASGETKLGWLYLTQIAFNEFKKSEIINTFLLELTIELYKKYLLYKNKPFPVSKVYLCGDITDSTKQIMATSDYFKFNITSFPRGKFKNTPKFKEEIKKNDFVLMELSEDIEDELFYELGLVAGMEKPIIVLISENINSFNKLIPKIATVISNRKLAFTTLKLFSVIKSGESLAIEDKTEKSAIDELMRGFKEKPLFISQFDLDKPRMRGLSEVNI